MASASDILARLTRIRSENRVGRVVDGLGSLNVPFARAHSQGSFSANVATAKIEILQARAALSRLDDDIDKQANRIRDLRHQMRLAQAEARALQGQAGSAIAGAGRSTLAERLKGKGFGLSRSKLEAGPVELGRGGLSMNMGFIRGVAGKAFTAAIIGQVAAGTLHTGIDAFDAAKAIQKKGGTSGEVARAGGLAAAGGIRQFFGSLTGFDDAMQGILRLRGLSKEDAKSTSDKFYREMFTTKEELVRRQDGHKTAIQTAYKEIDKQVGDVWHRINTTLPETFKLRNRGDLLRYREEMRNINHGLIEAIATAKKNEAKNKIDAKVAEGN